MAHSSGSPDAPTRSLPSWAAPDHSESFDEALRALESYKKKDPSKGKSFMVEWLYTTQFMLA
jgi:ubiquitin-like protein ATG12